MDDLGVPPFEETSIYLLDEPSDVWIARKIALARAAVHLHHHHRDHHLHHHHQHNNHHSPDTSGNPDIWCYLMGETMVSCRCSLQPSDVKNLRPEKFLGQEVLICFDATEIQEISGNTFSPNWSRLPILENTDSVHPWLGFFHEDMTGRIGIRTLGSCLTWLENLHVPADFVHNQWSAILTNNRNALICGEMSSRNHWNQILVDGLVAIFGIFPYIGNVIIPIDEVIFLRGVALAHQPESDLWLFAPVRMVHSWLTSGNIPHSNHAPLSMQSL